MRYPGLPDAMRRFLLILLLLMMPLQATWAAGAPYCSHDEPAAHTGHHAHTHSPSASQDRDDGAPGHCDDCDACHHLSASAVLSAQPNLPLPKGAPHLRGELRRYVSHIPEPTPPPDRPLRS